MKVKLNWARKILFKLGMMKNDIPGYCPSCDSCGEEGCCSPISCAHYHMVKKNDKKCHYGTTYFRDLQFSHVYSNRVSNIIEKYKDQQPEMYKEHQEMFDELYNQIYIQNKENEKKNSK